MQNVYFSLMSLNPSQLEAIQATDGPLLIVAGPGSGKTTTLTLKMAYLVREGVTSPESILAVTFTQKAAREILERVQGLQDMEETLPFISTFHGLAHRMLRENSESLGIPEDFKTLTDVDQQKLVKSLLKDHPEVKVKSKALIQALSHWKVTGEEIPEPLRGIFSEYQVRLARDKKLDFDDLLRYAVQLLDENPDILAHYQDQFKYILVDEYQDTNTIQSKLMHLLAQNHRNLTVIGDPDQAIYAFPGANIGNFMEFKTIYPEAKEIHLTENYRCPKTIVDASDRVIARNLTRLTKESVAHNTEEPLIEIVTCANGWQEGKFLTEAIQRHAGGVDHLRVHNRPANEDEAGYSFSDMVVLYRTNRVGKFLEKSFSEAGIPFQHVGEKGLFDHKEVRDFLDHVKALHEGAQGTYFPNEKLSQHLRRLIEQLHLKERYADGSHAGELCYDHLLDLLNTASTYDHLSPQSAFQELYQDASLAKSTDHWDPHREGVSLMTVRAAKGLEFPVVFLVGLEEGLFPYATDSETLEHLEEERRLFYVAMTRAKEKLILSHAQERFIQGENVPMLPSRFLSEIPEELTEKKSVESRKPRPIKPEVASPQMELF